jgi:hypothetical protein
LQKLAEVSGLAITGLAKVKKYSRLAISKQAKKVSDWVAIIKLRKISRCSPLQAKKKGGGCERKKDRGKVT